MCAVRVVWDCHGLSRYMKSQSGITWELGSWLQAHVTRYSLIGLICPN